jgi:hypothetical protein
VAETEVPAHHHLFDFQLGHQDLAHEGLGGNIGEVLVEVPHEEVFDTQFLQGMNLDSERRQPEWRILRPE